MCHSPRLFCLLLLPIISLAVQSTHAGPPNIVIILADDMGYGDVSCNNPDSKIQTPNIDRIAKDGVRFTDGHSGGSSCIPSRYALMTGRFAVRASMSLSKGPLIEAARMTVPSLLRDNGYSTAMVGKWHLGFDPFLQNKKAPADYSQPLQGGPVDRGFDSFFGMHASLDLPPYFYIRDQRPVLPPTNRISANSSVGGPEGWNNIQGEFWREGMIAADTNLDDVTPRFFEEAETVIKTHVKKDSGKPLFLYLALPSPHTPWLPKQEFRGKSGAGMYGDFVLQVDNGVGRILTTLKDAGIDDNTLVLFSSDNGPVWYDKDVEKFAHAAVGKLRGMKFASWEGGHRMPFLVRWPSRIAKGRVCSQTVVFSDVFATFAELLKASDLPAGTAEDSVSFLPWLVNPDKLASVRTPIIHDGATIRDGDWKLILPKQRRRSKQKTPSKKQANKPKKAQVTAELYNLKTDLSERTNLIERHPKIAARLKQQLAAFGK